MANDFDFTTLATNQSGKEASINEAVDQIAGVLGDRLDLNIVGGASISVVTPTASQCKRYSTYRFIDDVGTPPATVWSTVFALTNMITRPFLVINDGSKSWISLRNVAGDDYPFMLGPGQRAIFIFDSVADTIRMEGVPHLERNIYVDVASTANLDPTTVNAGDSVDSVTLTVGMVMLFKNNTAGAENGVYIIGNDAAHRVHYMGGSDFTTELPSGVIVTVRGGTVNAGRVYVMTAAQATVGTDPQTWTRLAASGGGSVAFTDLTDAPASYAGAANQLVKVNTGATGLEFSDQLVNQLRTAAGSVGTPALGLNDTDTGLYSLGSDAFASTHGGVQGVRLNAFGLGIGIDAASGVPLSIYTAAGLSYNLYADGALAFLTETYNASTAGPTWRANVGRGSLAVPTVIPTSQKLMTFTAFGYGGTAFRKGAEFNFRVVEATPSDTAMATQMDIELSPVGAVATSIIFRLVYASGLSLYGSVVIDQDRILRPRSYTLATLPVGAAGAGPIYVTDLGGVAGWMWAGASSTWHRVTQDAEVAVATDADFTLTPNTSAPLALHTGALTANRTITLSSTGARIGTRWRVRRLPAAANNLFTLSLGGLILLKPGEWAEAVYNGSAYVLMASSRNESIIIAASDETTALTTGTAKMTFRMPYAFTVVAVRGSLSTAQASGSIFTVDVNEAGTTILSTKLTIDNTEKTTTTAATPLVISDTLLADDAEITIDIDSLGDGTAKGLKVVLIGYQTP